MGSLSLEVSWGIWGWGLLTVPVKKISAFCLGITRLQRTVLGQVMVPVEKCCGGSRLSQAPPALGLLC